MQEFGMKELEKVVIKTTYPIEINGRTIEEGEVIAMFDKISMSDFTEGKRVVAAKGGYKNLERVYWVTTQEVRFRMVQGVFSKTQFSLMTNSKLISNKESDLIEVSEREFLESNENGEFTLKEIPIKRIFCYNGKTFEKISIEKVNEKTFKIPLIYQDIIVDYIFDYSNSSSTFMVGTPLTNGYLTMEGRTKVKDDITGHTHTGIIKIPKLKLMSSLSMTLGTNAIPTVGRLDCAAVPIMRDGEAVAIDLTILEDDIDSDI